MYTNWPYPDQPNEPCPLAELLRRVGGKWKCVILWWLMGGPKRFTALRQRLHGITQKMLTQQLRELERDGFLTRTVFAEVPPRVEYAATPLGLSLRPVLAAMHDWASEHLLGQTSKSKSGLKRKRGPATSPADGC